MENAEFDAFAADYEAGMRSPLMRCAGGDAAIFLEFKVAWLLDRLRLWGHDGQSAAALRVLDYGCGPGTMLGLLRQRNVAGSLAGCDVSREILAEATRRWHHGPPPELAWMPDDHAPFADGQFDVVVASSVLHHVELSQRRQTYADMLRLLRPGGHLCVFEHNPLNPLTQWVVRHAPMDRNARLLWPRELRNGLRQAGAADLEIKYLLFVPPRLRFCWSWQRPLAWLPLGAQYAVIGSRRR
jgi:SAM-dependent methyltransferase